MNARQAKKSKRRDVGKASPPPPPKSKRSLDIERYQLPIVLVVVIIGIAAVHGRSLVATFHLYHWEDVEFIKYVQQWVHSFAECFTAPPLYAGLYRPLTTSCYYYLGLKFFAVGIEPFKVLNLFLFAGNALLVFMIARRLLPFVWALIAGALFATRLAHHDLAIVTVEVQSLLSVFYCLLTLYFFLRSRTEGNRAFERVSYLSLVLALFSKETSLAIVGVILVYGWLFDRNFKLKPYAVHAGIAIVWVGLFFGVFRGLRDYQPTPFLYTYLPGELLRNTIAHISDFSNFLVPPMNDINLRFGPRIMSLAMSKGLQAVLAILIVGEAALVILHRRLTGRCAEDVRVIAFAFAFFLISMVPYLILKDRLYIRYSYVGHIGLALVAAALLRVLVTEIRLRAGARPTKIATR